MRIDLSKLGIDWPDVSPVVRYDQIGVYPKNRQGRLRLIELGINVEAVKRAKAWTLTPIWKWLDEIDLALSDTLWFAQLNSARVDSLHRRIGWPMLGESWGTNAEPASMLPNGYAVEVMALKPRPGSGLLLLAAFGELNE